MGVGAGRGPIIDQPETRQYLPVRRESSRTTTSRPAGDNMTNASTRARTSAPWRAAVSALLLSTSACGSGASQPGAYGDVTLKNWRTHPRIAEIRAIYEEIQREQAQGRGTAVTRRFDYNSPQCQATYPVQATSLWQDEAGRTRAYVVDQTVSHRDAMRIERYYDQEGRLRFVLVNRFPGETRVYLGNEGAVLWAVSGDHGPDADEPYDRDDWETKPSTAAQAKVDFEGTADCPEVKPSR